MKLKPSNFIVYVSVVIFLVDADGISGQSELYEDCGVDDGSSKLMDGKSPFNAAIYSLLDCRFHFICGGTSISKRAVITGKLRISQFISIYNNQTNSISGTLH